MISNHILYIAAVCFATVLVCTGCAAPKSPAPVEPAPKPINNPPIISSLTADQQTVQPLGKVNLDCQASDPESDNLSYYWGASEGTLEGSGASVTWTAPKDSGSYKVTVVVSDGKGGSATSDALITVPEKPNNPPVISAIKFTPDKRGLITVKRNPTDEEKRKYPPVVVRWTPVVIECVASDADNDNLNYTWKASGGRISGAGPTIDWVVGEAGSYTITCEVSDGRGGTDSFTVFVTVKCCNG